MKKPFFYPVIYMVIVTAVFIAILATFNYLTADTINFNNENEIKSKILYIFNILPDNENPKQIENIFDQKIKAKSFNKISGYALIENNEEVAYAIPINGPGLWGSITGYIGLNKDFTKITGIDFVTQSETPGLGGRISESEFKEQFREIDIKEPINGSYIISRPQPNGNIDAISGATQTSAAVVKFINEDLNEFFNTVEVNK